MVATDPVTTLADSGTAEVPPHVARWWLLANDQPTADRQMALDVELAERAEPTLRLFRWAEPGLSTGYRQPLPAGLDVEALRARQIGLVERPTGGGLAIHGSDLSWSVVAPHAAVPSVHGLMRLACESLVMTLRGLGIPASSQLEGGAGGRIAWCLAEPSPFAITVGGHKLAGLAVRRFPDSWLIQGSMLVRPIPAAIDAVLPPPVREAFIGRATSLQQAAGRKIFDVELVAAVARGWRSACGVPCEWAQIEWPRSQTVEWLNQGDVLATKWWRRTYAPGQPAARAAGD